MMLASCFLAALTLAADPVARTPAVRADELARASPVVERQWTGLLEAASGIAEPKTREAVLAILKTPGPTFIPNQDVQAMQGRLGALAKAGLVDAAVTLDAMFPPLTTRQSFRASPGGTLDGHHAYPGGLVEHTYFNLQAGAGPRPRLPGHGGGDGPAGRAHGGGAAP